MQNIVLINKSRTVWSTEILVPFLSFSGNLLQVAYVIFQKKINGNFEIAQKPKKKDMFEGLVIYMEGAEKIKCPHNRWHMPILT